MCMNPETLVLKPRRHNPHWPSGFEGCGFCFCPTFDPLSRFARFGARAFHLNGKIEESDSVGSVCFSPGVRPKAAPGYVGAVTCFQVMSRYYVFLGVG